MKIEAFSEGKNLDAPEANEDQFLILPSRGYAVLDGATDNTGRLYDGAEAYRIGLADRLTSPDELLDTALQLAGEIAANPRPQLQMIKALLTQNAVEADLRLVQEREHELIRECWRSPEHRRAVDAFLAKSG